MRNFNATGYCFRTWNKRHHLPSQPIYAGIAYGHDDFLEIFDLFRHEVNSRIEKGDTIVYMTHQWNFTFKTPEGVEYDLYMYETSSLDDARTLEIESRDPNWVHPNMDAYIAKLKARVEERRVKHQALLDKERELMKGGDSKELQTVRAESNIACVQLRREEENLMIVNASIADGRNHK